MNKARKTCSDTPIPNIADLDEAIVVDKFHDRETHYKISNVKLSLLCQNVSLNSVTTSKQHSNFEVIKDVFTFTIFPRINGLFHINVTKVECVCCIKQVFCHLKKIFPEVVILSWKIDNLTVTFQFPHKINLSKFYSTHYQNFNVMYNDEKFPGLFLKFEKGTLILFSSGKSVLVGCSNEKDIIANLNKTRILLENCENKALRTV